MHRILGKSEFKLKSAPYTKEIKTIRYKIFVNHFFLRGKIINLKNYKQNLKIIGWIKITTLTTEDKCALPLLKKQSMGYGNYFILWIVNFLIL